ncbi:MAG: hypothetical protein M3Y87_06055 [Myxococcota bacterium]|nr:hypothetical protein [Myxococcota bacterium]
MTNSKNTLRWIVAALALPMIGCVGLPSPEAGLGNDELLVDEGQLDPLARDDWSDALAGCEGLLDGDEHFALASAEDGLVAALGADGEVVCVDTVEAVEAELSETGQDEAADELVTAFAATIRALDMATDPSARFDGRTYEGDPDPQPNMAWNLPQHHGDPDPQPNSGM